MSTRGVSQPLGVALLLAIVLLLAALVASLAFGFAPRAPAPQVAAEDEFYTVYDNSTGEVYQYASLTHGGGSHVDPDELRVVIDAAGTQVRGLPHSGGGNSYRTGDQLRYNLTSADLCATTADEFRMQLVHEPSGSIVVERQVPIERGVNVQVIDNAVRTDRPFVATVEIVGLAASARSGNTIQPDVVYGRIVVSYPNGTMERLTPWPDGDTDDTTAPWDDDLNHPTLPGSYSYTTAKLPANATVTLEMRAPKPNGWQAVPSGNVQRTVNGNTYDVHEPDQSAGVSDSRFWIDTADPNEQNIILRRDGDSVPTYGTAASHQPSLSTMLQGRLGPSGQLNLDSQEVAVLFELSEPNADPANAPPPNGGGNPDYNDAVGLIDVQPIGASFSAVDGQPTLQCS